MSDHGLCTCGYPPGYTRRLEDELRDAQRRIWEASCLIVESVVAADTEIDRISAERDAWSEEAGRRGLALATVQAKYAALLEVCAEFAHGNREER